MQPFRSILVDIDAAAPAHPAFDRAVRLARACGARLTVCDVATIPEDARRYLRAGLEEEYLSRRREQLEAVVKSAVGVAAEPRLLFGRPATVLIQEVLRSGHDLLMRSHGRDLVARGPKPYGAVDMELFRQCPCPVMVIRAGTPPERPRILGAVHATDEPVEAALNEKIVESTLLLAQLERGRPMLLQAWTPYGEHLARLHSSEEAFLLFVEELRKRAAEDLARLAAPHSHHFSPDDVVLRRGAPEDVIPEFAISEDVDLVVMGTVARGGIAGLVFGNTAERVLRRLTCSVLALKPDGFVSPVRLDSL